MKSKMVYGVIILWIMALGKYVLYDQNNIGESLAVTTISSETSKSCIVELSGQYTEYIEQEYVETLLFSIAKQLQINTGVINSEQKENGYEVVLEKDGVNGYTTIKFLSIVGEGKEAKNYIVITIDLKNNIEYGITYQNLLEKIGQDFHITGIPTQQLQIQYDKILSLEEKNSIIKEICEKYYIKEQEGVRGSDFYTIYGYTPNISYRVKTNEMYMNVNIAFNRNGDKTNMLIGIPVIKNDY